MGWRICKNCVQCNFTASVSHKGEGIITTNSLRDYYNQLLKNEGQHVGNPIEYTSQRPHI